MKDFSLKNCSNTCIKSRIKENENVNLLDMKQRSFEDFKYNYFIPQKTNQPCIKEFQVVQIFTGNDPTYMCKKESEPRFSVENSKIPFNNINQHCRPDLDIFKQLNKYKNMEAPCEKIRVGPAMAVDVSCPSSGGLNSALNYRVMPNNPGSYTKNQLPGVCVPGKRITVCNPQSNPGIGTEADKCMYGVPKKGNEKYYIPCPVAYGRSGLTKESCRPSYQIITNKISYDVLKT